jgi:signal-transduction protein with cAMP-binding, CBS, and nucleotidyltransferase domain
MATRTQKPTAKTSKDYLAEVIRGITDISEENIKKILDTFEMVEYDKNTQIIKEGEITSYVYFVTKGIVKIYGITKYFVERGLNFQNRIIHLS